MSRYVTANRELLDRLFSQLKAEVDKGDVHACIELKKKLSKQLVTGTGMRLVTVDNQGKAIRYVEAAINRLDGHSQADERTESAAAYVERVMCVSAAQADAIVKKYGDPRRAKTTTTTTSEGNTNDDE